MYKILMAMILWGGMIQTGWALTVEERLLAGLQAQGYTVIEKGYTFLGRLRIVAESSEIYREIVVNPATGEILRDYAIYLTNMPASMQVNPPAKVANRNSNRATSSSRSTATGTADVAVSSLAPGNSTLGIANLQIERNRAELGTALEQTMLPMSPGEP